jgi:hypothetical protein
VFRDVIKSFIAIPSINRENNTSYKNKKRRKINSKWRPSLITKKPQFRNMSIIIGKRRGIGQKEKKPRFTLIFGNVHILWDCGSD